MSAHRFRALLSSTSAPRANTSAMSCGFVPCPAPLLCLIPAPQQQFVQEVYRLARERAEAQLRPAVRQPEFSRN
jgi:hypothetical protein